MDPLQPSSEGWLHSSYPENEPSLSFSGSYDPSDRLESEESTSDQISVSKQLPAASSAYAQGPQTAPAHPVGGSVQNQRAYQAGAIPLSELNRLRRRPAGLGEVAHSSSPNYLPTAPIDATTRNHYNPEVNPDFKSRGHLLGFATVATGLGAVLGIRLGGTYGGIAGTLFAGSATNAYRAVLHGMQGTNEGRREALISGTWSVIAAGAAGYILYATRSKMTPNRDASDEQCTTKNGRRSCGIRAII